MPRERAVTRRTGEAHDDPWFGKLSVPRAADLTAAAHGLQHWMHTCAWPLWWGHGRLANGAFHEALDFDGSPIENSQSRVRTQARQIYSFALAHKSGCSINGLDTELLVSIERFRDTCLRPDGIAGRVVDIRTGKLVDDTADLYDTAFWLLALARCRDVLEKDPIDAEISRLLEGVDARLACPMGNGYREELPAPAHRRHNPHMHFFESLLTLYEATGHPAVRSRIESLLEFIRASFFDVLECSVIEEVDEQMKATHASFEPGHLMEWVWLLGYRSRLFNISLDEAATAMYERVTGLNLDIDCCPMLLTTDNDFEDASCRLWSQTECLKAHLCIAELGPGSMRAAARQRAVDCARAIAENWLSPACSGGWFDHFDADRKLISRNMPASTGYHLFLAISELIRVADDSLLQT